MALAPIKGISGTYSSDKTWVNTVIGTDEGLNKFGSFGGITKDRTLGFNGAAKPGDSVQVFDGAKLLGTVKVDSVGRWNYLTTTLQDGIHSFKFVFSDGSSLNKTPLKVDSTGPALSFSSKMESLTGANIFSGTTTSTADLFLSGSAKDFGSGVKQVRIYDGVTYLGNATVSGFGTWSFKATNLLNGSHSFNVRAVDNAGNESAQNGPQVTISRDPGVLAKSVKTDTELAGVANGGVTKDTTPTFTGTGVKGSTVEIWEGSKRLLTEILQSTGTFELTLNTALAQGAHSFTAKLINGTVTETQGYSFTVETPAKEGISAVLVTNEKSGLVEDVTQGQSTLGDLIELRGTREPWSRVEVFDNGVYLGRVNMGPSKQWSFKTTKPLDLGAHKITVEVIDHMGKGSAFEATSFTVGHDGTTPQHLWSSEWGWGAVDVLDALQIATGNDYENGAENGRQEIVKHNFDDAWREGFSGRGIRVAVIDTGVDLTNTDLMPNLLTDLCYDFVNADSNATDDNGHGTFVMSQMAAASNGVGITGAAYGAEYFAVKAMNQNGSGGVNNLIKAIRYSVDNGADIINLSLGSEVSSPSDSHFISAIQYAQDHGVLIVAGAGNSAGANPIDPAILAKTFNNVIAVGSSQWYGKGTSQINDDVIFRSDFSNKAGSGDPYGFVTAVGRQNTGYGLEGVSDIELWSGTSMATPMVSAAAAIVWGANQDYTAEQVRAVLIASTHNQFVI